MTAIATNRAPARTAAEELLQSELQSGPRHAAELVELAKARGISASTLQAAKVSLGIRSRRQSRPGVSPGPGRWVWELDPAEQEAARRARLVDWLQARSELPTLSADERARLKRELDRFVRRWERRGL
jgi:hypothetical protein